MDIDIIKNSFDEYVKSFDMNNYDIKYKYNHSYRVMNLSNMIARSLKLSSEDIKLATAIGLLHDIGRFEQIELFNSYSDKNIDHADLGAKILFEDNLIEKFKIDKKYYDVINFSIRNHNKLSIESNLDSSIITQAKLIRDADKLDILEAFVIYKDYKLKESKDEISEDVKKDFYNRVSVNGKNLKNLNDHIILFLAFVFDINFRPSLEYIKNKKLIEKLYNSVENKDIFEPYFKYVFEYLDGRN